LKKPSREKKLIKILKKPTGSVRFWFFKPRTKKTKPNRTRTETNREKNEPNRKNRAKPKKPSQTKKTEPNRFEPVFVLKNRTEPKSIGLNRFRFFYKKILI
jgi:hypothetical protein